MKLAKINNQYSKNILSKILPDITKVVTSEGNATFDYVNNNIFGSKSLRVNCTNHKNTDLSFNFGSDLQTPIILNNIYFFSFFIKTDNDIKLEVSLTGSRTGTEIFEIDILANTKVFQRFTQSKVLYNAENFNLSFKLIKNADANNSISFLIDGLKLELNSGLGLPENFTKPENSLGWERMLDVVNSQTILENTETKIIFNNNILASGIGLNFIDVVNSKIKPLQVLDVLKIDFTFSFPSPSGTNDYFKIYLKVANNIYRANSFNILEPTGEINFASVNFSLPVESDFLINGAELFIKSSVGITISNKYLFVQRTYKSE